MRSSKLGSGWALAVALCAAGCGSGGNADPPAGDGGPITPTSGPYQPLTVGTTWTYHVDDQGVVYDKQSSVEALENIGGMADGIMGYRVRETIKSSIQLTWYEVTATDVRRHHDQVLSGSQLTSEDWYTPYLLRVDTSADHLKAGASWTMTYMDTKTTSSKPTQTTTLSHDWHVDSVGSAVTVPAGTFAALQVTFTDKANSTSTKTQWFVQGIGKVKEQTSGGHTEQLTAYTIAP
jgi:hypothetical protein